MKKWIALTLAIILALSLLAGCGGNDSSNSGGNNGGSSTTNSTQDNSGSNSNAPPASDSGNSGAAGNTPAKEEPGGIRTPDVTVINEGDVIFDNGVITTIYNGIVSDSPEFFIYMYSKNNSGRDITITTDYTFINGVDLGAMGYTFYNLEPEGAFSKGDHMIWWAYSAIEDKGFSVEEIKTIQLTFTVTVYGKKDVLFEGTALFKVEQ